WADWSPQELAQTRHGIRQAWRRDCEVDAEADDGGEAVPRGRDALDQEPRELGAVRDEIVRPFQPDVHAAEIPHGPQQRGAGDEPDLWRDLGFARAQDQRARMQVSRG